MPLRWRGLGGVRFRFSKRAMASTFPSRANLRATRARRTALDVALLKISKSISEGEAAGLTHMELPGILGLDGITTGPNGDVCTADDVANALKALSYDVVVTPEFTLKIGWN